MVSLGPPLFLSASCDWSGKFWEVSVSGLGIEPSFAQIFSRGAKAPTFAPGSYKGLRRRPQFYPQQSGALIRNVFLPGRGSIFPSLSFYTGGAFLLTGDPLQCFHVVCVAWGRFPSGRFWPRFSSRPGFEPPDDASEHECVPTEPAGHRHVQPPALRSTLDIIVDPCRFGFSPIF